MKWVAIVAGIGLGLLLTVFKILESAFYAKDLTTEAYIGLVSLICLGAGLWFGRRAYPPAAGEPVGGKSSGEANPSAVVEPKFGLVEPLSNREEEVLQLLAAGFSNDEIAGRLSVSINTIKTHVARIYTKLQAQRRTQAVDRARRLGLIRN